MLTLLRPGFPHRQNADGTYDSICTACLATVANVKNEWELAPYESDHVCDPIGRYRVSQGLGPQPSISVQDFFLARIAPRLRTLRSKNAGTGISD
jgi:hypothetical protein